MYFASRADAGKQLSGLLKKHSSSDVVLLALSEGGVVVGAHIAAELHCPLTLLLTGDITLPGERSVLGVVDQAGGFTYNDMFSPGELEEFEAEYHTYIEEQKAESWHKLSRLLGRGGLVSPDLLRDKVVILVSDGLVSGISLLAAVNYLKPIHYQRLVVATPFASTKSVDKMHVLTDEIQVLDVMADILDIGHYYETDDVPSQEDIVRILGEAIKVWEGDV